MASLVEILIELKDQATEKFNELLGSVGKVSGAVDILKVGLEAIAGGAIVAGLEHLVGLFAEHEMGIVRLNESLRVTGRYSAEGTDAIQKMAETIAETTTTSREAALGVSTLAAAFTKTLSGQQLADLQKAAVAMGDLFMHGDAERAGRMLVRGLEGSGAMLKRYGIEIDKASSEQERFQKIMERFGPLFDVSTAAGQTLGGQIAIAKNQFSELEETLGEVIVRSTGLEEKGHTIADMIIGWKKSIEENETAWVHWGTVTFNFLKAIFETVKYLVLGFFEMGQVIGDAFMLGLRVIGDTVEALYNVGRIIGDLVVLGVTWLESKWGDFANWLIDKFNDLILLLPEKVRNFLGVSVIGHIANAAAEELADAKKNVTADANATAHAIDDMSTAAADTRAKMADHFGAIEDGATRMANSWRSAVASINATPVKPPDTAHEGGGENRAAQSTTTATLTDRVHQLVEAEKALNAEYKAGMITEKEYLATKATLRAGIEEAIGELKKEQIAVSDPRFKEHLKLLTDLINAYNALGGAVTKFSDAFRKAWIGNEDPVKKANEDLAKMAVTFSNSLANGIATAIEASGNFGKAIEKTIAEAAKAESIHALAQGIEELAKAFADPLQSGRHIAAAEKFFESAAVYAAVAGLAGGFGGGGGGGGAAAQTQAVSNLAGGNVTVNVPNTFTSDPGFWDALIGGLEQAGLKNVHVVSQG